MRTKPVAILLTFLVMLVGLTNCSKNQPDVPGTLQINAGSIGINLKSSVIAVF